ncbi:TonB-dependent receptor plug domain-containing protein [Sphingopyxis flava]|uniref:TonB dependent receptor n=1 Tax=Sphingopyxis flava TaxID=1507287 RepID=A0A1T5C4C7_9SPHN|nr:TonB-dependent receptor plug domain-containing protein [Sphingopyxis flava]SKB54010.1 TonB dependent receptor [Sphingopyxis flava]
MKFAASLLAIAAAPSVQPALAQDAPASGEAPPPAADAAATLAKALAGKVYTPADFARYAPKNAYDMLNQVPGFSIRETDTVRGLGQATGNVLFNGARPSTKSDTIAAQLTRIPAANVERIEIVDGANLDLPGLSGQVANIVFRADSFSGQFSWKPEFRPHYTDPLFTRADISVRGRKGDLEYELGLNNDASSRSGAGGGTVITDGAGAILENRKDIWNTHYDTPKLSAKLTWDPAGDSIAHLGAHIQRRWYRYNEDGVWTAPGGLDRLRTVRETEMTWNYEVSGDYQFGLGPGKLKLIGLRRFSHEPVSQEVVLRPTDGSPASGDCFTQTGNVGETIARGEYDWRMFGGDWQLSGEAAFNTLGNVARLYALDPATDDFVELPFPEGTGGVREDRYEALLSFGRKLTNKLSFQLVAGAEHSTLAQDGTNGLRRSFFRPKGTLTLAWTSAKGLDLSLKAQRQIEQLDFYDFLARAFLNDDNNNAGNADLRPQQNWRYEFEANQSLGKWGSAKLQLVYVDAKDFVDVVPVDGGESVGNIPKAWAAAVAGSATINLDPAGLKGVKIDLSVDLEKSGLRDPFTGEKRQWSGFQDRSADFSLRHDIPGSDWAWGASASYGHSQPHYRRDEVNRTWEGPVFASLFVENKDVMGLTVRAEFANAVNARSRRERTVYEGLRAETPVAFHESRDRLIGPIFAFSVRGKF